MNSKASYQLGAGRIWAFALAVLLTAGFTACGDKNSKGKGGPAGAAGSPVEGDWVIVHDLSDPETLNLVTATDATSQEIHGLMYEQLLNIDPHTLASIPWIADSLPTISADHKIYEFRLRKDAKFSDGQPVTGNDFIFFLKCIKNPNIENAAPQRSFYTRLEKLELIDGDPYRLRATMNEPYFLGQQIIGELYAFPKHIWDPENLSDAVTFDQLNKGDTKNPNIGKIAEIIKDVKKGFDKKYLVCSGRYMFDESIRNERVSLVRNPNYWNKSSQFGKAYVDKIVYRTINDPNAALTALKAGEIDFYATMEKVAYNSTKPKLADFNLMPAEVDYPAYTYIGYNERNPIFQDKLVRRALSHMIDRDQVIKNIYFGLARTVQSPVFYMRPEYDTTIPTIKYDVAKAKELLAQAGWADSDGDGTLDKMINGKKTDFTFKIMLNSGNKAREQVALIFIDGLKRIGIKAETVSLEWATYLQRTRDGQYDAAVSGWAMNPTEGDMYQIWHSASTAQGGSNHVYYKNPEVDKLIESIRGEFDIAKRTEMQKKIQQIINEDQPYTFLISPKQTGAYHNRFQNVEFFAPRPCFDLGAWWVPTSAQKYKSPKAVATNSN